MKQKKPKAAPARTEAELDEEIACLADLYLAARRAGDNVKARALEDYSRLFIDERFKLRLKNLGV